MGSINTSNLQPDMILASDLFAPNGRFLLPKGTVLEHKHIRIMAMWGVPEADVTGAERGQVMDMAISQIDPMLFKECEELLARRFRAANLGHPVMQELHQLALLRLSQQMAGGSSRPASRDGAGAFASPDADPQGAARDLAILAERRSRLGAPPALEALASRHVNLCSLPDIYHRIVEVIHNPRSSATHIAEVVSKDVSLAARLLKLVNSPFYGFPGRIDTIHRAVTLLGSSELLTLAHGITVISNFEGMAAEGLDMQGFWEHSVACGLFARALAGLKPGLSEERFFVAGLLHDIGRLVLLKELPDHMRVAMALARAESMPLWRAERAILGYDHAQVASLLLKHWHFPADLERIIASHHEPLKAVNILEAAFVTVADIIALALGYGASGSSLVPSLDARAWKALEASPGVIAAASKQVDRQLGDIMRMFFDA